MNEKVCKQMRQVCRYTKEFSYAKMKKRWNILTSDEKRIISAKMSHMIAQGMQKSRANS